MSFYILILDGYEYNNNNVFINDVVQCFHTYKFLLFAHDLKIFNVLNNISDSIDIQKCLNDA